MSLSDSSGTLYVWAGRSLGEVIPQFHLPSVIGNALVWRPVAKVWRVMVLCLILYLNNVNILQ